jgi:hypothetical protein
MLVGDVVDDQEIEPTTRHLLADGLKPAAILAALERQWDHAWLILFVVWLRRVRQMATGVI